MWRYLSLRVQRYRGLNSGAGHRPQDSTRCQEELQSTDRQSMLQSRREEPDLREEEEEDGEAEAPEAPQEAGQSYPGGRQGPTEEEEEEPVQAQEQPREEEMMRPAHPLPALAQVKPWIFQALRL